ncbi:hypothetical protein IT418_04015 [bacterium]|nr:hypothetical protein [bacterium]
MGTELEPLCGGDVQLIEVDPNDIQGLTKSELEEYAIRYLSDECPFCDLFSNGCLPKSVIEHDGGNRIIAVISMWPK